MDLHCKHCGEPWDHDCLHEFDDYEKRCKLFAKLGCPALRDQDAKLSDDECQGNCIDPIKAAQSAAAIILSEYSDDWII